MTKKEEESKSLAGREGGPDLSARRARLRTSLNKQPLPSNEHSDTVEKEEKSSMSEAITDFSTNSKISQAIESVGKNTYNPPEPALSESVSILSHIDQTLNSYAKHLVSFQTIANKQIEELKTIAQVLQTRAISHSDQNLNPIMESLTAAIEPMKAIGELIPALDRLANVAQDQIFSKPEFNDDKLIISLAEQLLAGNIDSATFSSAYKAIFSGEDQKFLTHKLGELLDEQQLSGELFQVALQALQSDRINQHSLPEQGEFLEQGFAGSEEISNELLLKEEEYSNKLAEKEQEIQNMQQQLEGRWNELATQCEELKMALGERDDILRAKEAELNKKVSELSAKDSENQILKAQIEELKDKTKEMMTDLQSQLAKKQEEETNRKRNEESARKHEEDISAQAAQPTAQTPQSGFFDFVSTGSTSNTLFNTTSSPLFLNESANAAGDKLQIDEGIQEATQSGGWQKADIKTNRKFGASDDVSQNPVSRNIGANRSSDVSSDMQTNSQASASFVSAVGSYGSGVRAQVFEVIVRQALAGTQWREICAVPMQSNNISPEEVEIEVKRRQSLLKK